MKSFLFTVAIFLPILFWSQGWSRLDSMFTYDRGAGVVQTADGGYLTAFSHSYEWGDSKIRKYDWDGSLLWSSFFPNTHITHIGEDYSTGGYAILGISNLPLVRPTIFFKTDTFGNIYDIDSLPPCKWWNYGDFYIDLNGNYLLAGTRSWVFPPWSCPYPPPVIDIYDPMGTLIQTHLFRDTVCPVTEAGYFLEISPLTSGGILAVGTWRDSVFLQRFPFAVHLDGSWNVNWVRDFPGINGQITDFAEMEGDRIALWLEGTLNNENGLVIIDTAGSVVAQPSLLISGADSMDKIYYDSLTGRFTVIQSGVWITQFDTSGQSFSDHIYPGLVSTATHVDSRRTASGEYIITGHRTDSFPNGEDFYIMKVDSAGGFHTNLVTGITFFDSIQNCLDDFLDPGIQWSIVTANGNNSTVVVISDTGGYYSMPLDTGIYTITHIPVNSYRLPACPTTSQYTVGSSQSYTVFPGRDFGDTIIQGIQDLRAEMFLLWPQPTGTFNPVITTINDGTVPVSGVMKLVLDDSITFSSASVAPSFVIGDTMYWQYNNLLPLDRLEVEVIGTISTWTPFGWPLITYLESSPVSGDNTPLNNVIQQLDTHRLPFDPNIKLVQPAGSGSYGDVLINTVTEFIYMVCFQNTGTDTALTVVIRDSIDADIALNSFRFISSSHYMIPEITDGRTLKFTFPNILLPDSNANEPASHGYVRFGFAPENPQQVGTVISNCADIYFDYNLPIRTNCVRNRFVNIIGSQESVPASSLLLYPNPASEYVHVGCVDGFYRIFDIQGSLIGTGKCDQSPVVVAGWQDGIYFIETTQRDGNKNYAKLIVIR